jgi:hypothetical protein
MTVITLTSDWGLKDHYLAVVKGIILCQIPDAQIVDISHEIPPFNLRQASFILRNAYKSFPEGTIHIIAMNTIETKDQPHTAALMDGHYFIGTDNGIFSLIFDRMPDKMVELEIFQDSNLFTFATRDRFIKAAAHLAHGMPIEELGKLKEDWESQMHFEPVITDDSIRGMIIYIDNFENVITNITEKTFLKLRKHRKFSIEVRGEKINKISKSYLDVPNGEIVALFGSTGNLEIAINQGNASGLLGLNIDDPVSIKFE